ncbi:hypothetical protein LOK49_LG12G02308 [Camellia lanceoleosa]|uniref:Uncharacterized protein n=1 Tax=Camellia lanceoleosa TaxID=1840588 RepID=A0ACC0FSJ6_9ERIC|nr:hypothetical protein LOK49_LG12G02308 [Camellia lanceoleosa]
MARSLVFPISPYSTATLLYPSSASQLAPIHGRSLRAIRCIVVADGPCNQNVIRRSANYQPPIWDHDYVQSLNSKYVGDVYEKRAAKLKEDVKIMLEKVVDEDPLDALEMIDDLQRLGVFYHFKDEIETVLERIYNMNDKCNNEDLHATALKFRLLRQHGYNVPQDEARDFTTRNLKENLKKKDIDQNLAMLVRHSLELPLHWRVLRLEARWFIDVYERRQDMNSLLLELAKLDFNMVQAIHQQEVKQMSRWWRSTCLEKKLSFARDGLMVNFLGTLGVNFEPQFGYFRRMSTKVYTLITIIDDVYNVYGSLEELELFTNAVERWDIITKEASECLLEGYPNIICWSSIICRLSDDLGTSSNELQRGVVPKSIQCYMHETGASENDAREHMKYLIGETWKKMNEDGAANSLFTKDFIGIAMNLARMSQCMYQYGDGHGAPGKGTKYRVLSLVVNPVPLL